MRSGFTTGSCAAAAAKAAAYMLFSGTEKNNISIETPAGVIYRPEITDIERTAGQVSCAVIKDGGDDPDVTSGAHICACVSASAKEGVPAEVEIDGGKGVGRVTKPGLDQPVGNAAINHVPREMITKEVLEVCDAFDFQGIVKVVISVPGGEQIAEKTFNPRLGIEGGISIIGTSGIVEPMSHQALIDTIAVELRQQKALGADPVAVAPGNYGQDFMKAAWNYDIDKSVKCSNFIGETIDIAAELGIERLLLTGHIGKLIKVSGGIMNTHSREGDCRMELLAAAAIRQGASAETARKILECVVTEEGLRCLDVGLREKVMQDVMDHIMYYLNKRAGGKMEIECVMYSNDFGMLAESKGAEKWLTLLAQAAEQQTS